MSDDGISNPGANSVSGRQGLRGDLAGPGGPPFTPEAESTAIYNSFTAPPTQSRKVAINNFVLALKNAGLWTKMSCLYVAAAADSQAARINWKNPGTFTATAVNTVVFTADQGFTGNPTGAGYVETNCPANTSPVTTNSIAIIVHELTNLAMNGGAAYAANGYNSIGFRSGANLAQMTVNDFTSSSYASTDSSGVWVANRSASGARQLYRNGSLFNSDAIASSGSIDASTWKFCTTSTSFPAARQIAVFGAGSSFSAQNATDFYNAETAYIAALVAPSNNLLLADGSSSLLLTDGVSNLIKAA